MQEGRGQRPRDDPRRVRRQFLASLSSPFRAMLMVFALKTLGVALG